ncbi:hypothetical protein MSG28_000337 [Choristoneura fumiferana]|uniref:Uncharacterized protein n=1 Tax=Choristoneura fumiferana TaxID=7141 RepID=A0ACC0K0K9_CHOFU|nr:hypothetical protein MSG28_000337 [Choristoneura fumiferana]
MWDYASRPTLLTLPLTGHHSRARSHCPAIFKCLTEKETKSLTTVKFKNMLPQAYYSSKSLWYIVVERLDKSIFLDSTVPGWNFGLLMSVDSMDAYYGCLWDGTLLDVAVTLCTRRDEDDCTYASGVRTLLACRSRLHANNGEDIQRDATGACAARDYYRPSLTQYVF